jgi:uncharacterized membrane protein YjgN (DUF898 family)
MFLGQMSVREHRFSPTFEKGNIFVTVLIIHSYIFQLMLVYEDICI